MWTLGDRVRLLGDPKDLGSSLRFRELGKIPVCEGGESDGKLGEERLYTGKVKRPLACQMSQSDDAGSELWLGECMLVAEAALAPTVTCHPHRTQLPKTSL